MFRGVQRRWKREVGEDGGRSKSGSGSGQKVKMEARVSFAPCKAVRLSPESPSSG